MKLQRATLVSAAMLLGIVSAPDVLAGPGGTQAGRSGHGGGAQYRRHTAGGNFQGRYVTPYRAYSYYPRAAYWAAPGAGYYGSTSASSYATPALYYVPPLDPNAPPFSFNGSPAVELDWGWQRVNLQQLAAEVRTKREAGSKP